MVISAADYEKQLLDTLDEKTGKSLKDWMKIIKTSGEEKVTKITKWIKTEHKLNHSQANMLASVYLNDGKPVHGDFESLFSALLDGKEKIKPVYDKLLNSISENFEGYKVTPRKTYVQLDDKRCFAVIKINKTNVRLGMDLGNQPVSYYVQKAKSLGAMPRFSHMIEFKSTDDIDSKMFEFIEQSRERSA
jgi:hypothetical protein